MRFYLRRVAFYVITIWAAVSLNFLLPRMMPGDPAAIMIGKLRRASGGRELSPQVIQDIYALLGAGNTTSPWQQYLAYWTRLLHGDLGLSSTRYPYPVLELIGNALPWTLFMVGLATVLSFVLGIAGGAFVGWKRGTWLDQLVPATSLLQSIPYFWLALCWWRCSRCSWAGCRSWGPTTRSTFRRVRSGAGPSWRPRCNTRSCRR